MNALEQKKIVLIGTGYVGRELLKHLPQKNLCSVSRSINCPESPEHLTRKHHPTEIENKLKNADVIIIAVAPHNEETYEETYLKTAEWVLLNNSEAKIVYLSSTSVYGDYKGNLVDEKTPPKPDNPRARTLLATEEVINQSLSPVIFRLSGIYGKDRGLAKRVRENTPLPGSGEEPVNKIHVDDVIQAILFALRENLKGLFNLSDDEQINRRDLYNLIAKALHKKPPIFDPTLRSTHLGNKLVNNAKIKKTGFTLLHPTFDISSINS